jgi:hypothetical protein
LVAVPDKLPVIVLALKFPEPSLNTNVLGVLIEVADVNVLFDDCILAVKLEILSVLEFKFIVIELIEFVTD